MEIVKDPDKTLSTKSEEIVEIDDKIKDLIKKMWKVLSGVEGVGLAAPQIGVNLKISVIGFEPTESQLKKNPDLKPIKKMVIINPKILWSSKETIVEKEGCLSVEGKEIVVPRFEKIHVEYLDENGEKKKLKARGYFARVIQHEIDHLNGYTIRHYE